MEREMVVVYREEIDALHLRASWKEGLGRCLLRDRGLA